MSLERLPLQEMVVACVGTPRFAISILGDIIVSSGCPALRVPPNIRETVNNSCCHEELTFGSLVVSKEGSDVLQDLQRIYEYGNK